MDEEEIAITESNLNPVISIVTWLLLALMSLTLGFRLLTRFFLKANQTVGLEDMYIIAAYVCMAI